MSSYSKNYIYIKETQKIFEGLGWTPAACSQIQHFSMPDTKNKHKPRVYVHWPRIFEHQFPFNTTLHKKNPALHHEEFSEWMWRISFPAVQLWGYSINSKMLKIISQTPSQFWIYGTIIFANIFIFNFPIFHPIFHLPLLLAPTSVCSQVRCRRWRVQRHHHGLEGTIQAALQCLSVALNELHCWGLPSKKCKENVVEKYLDGKVQFF